MSTAAELIEGAFRRLSERSGFTERPDQKQLSLLLSDLIEERSTGAFEAPTGLGKSLAALIPAIAHGIADGRRTVIATYTNVLAEQYWRHDLPLALSLFEPALTENLKTAFLIGRQRYACLTAMQDSAPDLYYEFPPMAELGIETEFRQSVRRPLKELSQLWQRIAAPPVCPGRLCPNYNACYYYKGRRQAEKAHVIITNHSVVIQDALHATASESDEGALLGAYDFLILDEAHDFPQAAINGLEFELSNNKLQALLGIAGRIEQSLASLADRTGESMRWAQVCQAFKDAIEGCQKRLIAYSLELHQTGILTATPADVLDHPAVKQARTTQAEEGAKRLAIQVGEETNEFTKIVEKTLQRWRDEDGLTEVVRQARETIQNYLSYVRDYGLHAMLLFDPQGVAVTYVGRYGQEAILRQDVIDLSGPLRHLLWDRVPYACLSATLALDGSFDFFRRVTGAEPAFEEILPTPFDFSTQASLYLPKAGKIPDPTIARREGFEEEYYHAIANELNEIIRLMEGRTLALFHSRKEMEGVMRYIDLPPDLPVLMQFRSGAGSVGERFVKNVHASLFALRSFWTGFDAPGETLSCVVLVRVPFEVPVDPPQIARLAWLQTQGRDAFHEHSLPNAKMLMRQGAGRLIRRSEDRGIIALLDTRLRTKRYGEEILANLPPEMRTFDDFADAVGWVGIQPTLNLVH